MKREGSFRLKKPKLTILLGAIYFVAIAGIVGYLFMPKTADASSEERLFIPSIGLIARARDIDRTGNTLIAPDHIAGVYKSTNHKTVIIGHSSTIFNNLKDVKADASITFDNHDYKITKTEIIEKATVDMGQIVAETDKNTIILMTCYGQQLEGQDYSHRFIVTAEEV